MTGLTIRRFFSLCALGLVALPALAQDAEFETDDLSAAGAGTVGTLSLENGGLSVEMWADSNLDRVKFLLGHADVETAAPSMRSLVRKILLTEARLPDGATDEDGAKIFAERVRILFDMGDVIALEGLMERLSQTAPSNFPGYVRINLGQLLVKEGIETACAAPGRDSAAPEFGRAWIAKVNAACANLGDRGPDGDVQLELAKELGDGDDLFLTLVSKLRGEHEGEVEIPANATLDPLHIALMLKTGVTFTPAHLDQITPDSLVGLARSGRVPALIRAMAAERALDRGQMAVTDVRPIYNQLALQADAGETNVPPEGEATLARAQAYGHIVIMDDPNGRGREVVRVLRAAQSKMDVDPRAFRILALIYGDLAARIQPSPSAIADAGVLIRALMTAGKMTEAGAWHTLVVEQARSGLGVALRQLFEIWPLLVVSGPELGSEGASVLALDWYNFALQQHGQAGIDKAIAALSLIEAMGEPISADVWDRIMASRATSRTTAELPNLSIWRGVAEAAQNKRQAEAGFLALMMLQGGQLKGAHPVVISAILGAFLEAGMEADARAVARDAMRSLGL